MEHISSNTSHEKILQNLQAMNCEIVFLTTNTSYGFQCLSLEAKKLWPINSNIVIFSEYCHYGHQPSLAPPSVGGLGKLVYIFLSQKNTLHQGGLQHFSAAVKFTYI